MSQRRPLAGLDANLLVMLDAILETGSVAASAKQLGVSASAASHALARLRDVLGDPILVRSGRRMVTTARAREIAPALREGLALVEEAVAPPARFELAMVERELHVGAIDFATQHIVPQLVDMLRREAPRVDVLVRQFEPGQFEELGSGELSLIIALQRARTGTRQAPLLQEGFASVLRRGHPALGEKMTPKRFAALPQVLVSSARRRRGGVDDALGKLGLTRRVALVVPTFSAAASAVAQSDMILTGSRREAELAARHMPVVVVDVPVPIPPFKVSMFWHEREHAEPFMAWVRARLVALTDQWSGTRRT